MCVLKFVEFPKNGKIKILVFVVCKIWSLKIIKISIITKVSSLKGYLLCVNLKIFPCIYKDCVCDLVNI